MKKLEVSGTLITLDMFRCSVIVLVAKDSDTVIKGLPDLWKANGWNRKELPGIKKLIRDACENHGCFGVSLSLTRWTAILYISPMIYQRFRKRSLSMSVSMP